MNYSLESPVSNCMEPAALVRVYWVIGDSALGARIAAIAGKWVKVAHSESNGNILMNSKSLALTIAAAFGLAGAANAAPVEIAGQLYDGAAFADSVTVRSGAIETYDVGGTGVTSADGAIGGSVADGIRCASDGCSFLVEFDGGVENQAGADLAIYTLGVTDFEFFDIAYSGVRISDLQTVGTGQFFRHWEIGLIMIDLSDLDVALGESIQQLKIIVNRGVSSEEFASVVSLNDGDVLVNPIPAAAWLFGSALLAGGAAARKRKKVAAE